MSQSDTTPAADHDAKGRFAKGNAGGPGNPYARQVAELRRELLLRCTPERIGKIADRMMELAEEGNVSAAKLIFQYVLGKPHEAVSPDRVDIDEVQTFKDGSCKKDDLFPTLLGGVPADVSAELLRELTPIMGDLACAEVSKLGDVLRAERDEKAQPTVTKRGSAAQSPPADDWSDAVPAETELRRLVTAAVSKRQQTDQRAANPPRP
jgi:hypothetical protein